MNAKKCARIVAGLAVAGTVCAAAPAMAAAAPAVPHHAYGALVDRHPAGVGAALPLRAAATVPTSVDLSKYGLTPGDQGKVGSCVAWAIDYSSYSILEGEQGIKGAPHAPMYTYAQIAKGNDQGSYARDHFSILTSQGLDTKADYWQGDFDYTTQPDSKERANAAQWKLSGATALHTGSQLQNDVKNSLAQGMPVVFAFQVYQSFENLNSSTAGNYGYYPTQSELNGQSLGGHEIAIVGYNDQGVRVENSWGTGWGDGGYVNLPWKFVTNQIEEAHAVGKLVADGPTPDPGPGPTPGGTVSVTSPGDQWGFRGNPLFQTIQVSGNASDGGALTYSASGLPAGLSISSSGMISGTPTAGGTFAVTVTAKESNGTSGSASFSFQIYG
ncbi:C1 family peptidase [Amycolatopsis sp. H20-H5]|uniref:putative Ig domain-containing protein n=1 Tax=Amycolatopsis sp. H20-H5 TaxID=3046309 RepID=UPI002DBEC81C|nr:C1 family peptidase [Amycolatopsis sp. H20-H5]MEC3979957.1 C1 family peptidase [Amycolatopsis sp. H20-H5]